MPLIYKRNMNANGGRILEYKTITDAEVLSVGEGVKLTSGKLVTWGAGGAGYGVLVGFTKADKSPITDDGAGALFSGTYTAPTSNTVLGIVDISKESIYSVDADAALGTTTGSDLAGYNMDLLASSDQLNESSAGTGTASLFSHGVDPDGTAVSNSVLVSIQESQVWI